jgi:hypothetical protein
MLETTKSISKMLFPYGTIVSQERHPRMLELMGAYFLTQYPCEIVGKENSFLDRDRSLSKDLSEKFMICCLDHQKTGENNYLTDIFQIISANINHLIILFCNHSPNIHLFSMKEFP